MNKLEIKLEVTEDGYFETNVSIDKHQFTQYVEVFAFFKDLMYSGKNISMWSDDKYSQWQNKGLSNFYPFSCSCGSSGCAGIWNGIVSKHRKHTVEWRTKKEDGYGFMQRCYKFDKKQYVQAVKYAWTQLNEMFAQNATTQDHGDSVLLQDWFEKYYEWEDVKAFMERLCKNGTTHITLSDANIFEEIGFSQEEAAELEAESEEKIKEFFKRGKELAKVFDAKEKLK